jgi:hypothetical protein
VTQVIGHLPLVSMTPVTKNQITKYYFKKIENLLLGFTTPLNDKINKIPRL